MPEYGRLVQQMVEEALHIDNRAERQAYAEAIVGVMLGLNPQMKNVAGYREKLWDHLAYISRYQLDIDYPCEIRKPEREEPPAIPYPTHRTRFRHYGTLIEDALQTVATLPKDPARKELLRGIGTRMKRCLIEFRSETPDDRRIEHDIARVSNDAVEANFYQQPLQAIKAEQKPQGKKRKKK